MKAYSIAILVTFFLGAVHYVDAARLFLLPKSTQLGIGQEFFLDVTVDSEEAFINAAEAVVNFPKDLVEALEIDKGGSIFNFWVEEPTISNENGTMKFIGGSPKGSSGSSLKILRLKFKVTGSGSDVITLSEAVVTANDGKGTNALSAVEGASVSIGTKVVQPKIEQPVIIAPPEVNREEVKKQPERVVREAIHATGLPIEPVIRVPLYPNQNRWYNHIGDIVVFWDLPGDIIQVSTRLSRSKDKMPGEKDDELYTGKNLGPLMEEGEWFIRVQFRNNVGWGPIGYYYIRLDTTAPLPFEIEVDNAASDNPSPRVTFESQDSLSGIARYRLLVDGTSVLETASSTAILPPQLPGEHTLIVQAVDNAGNKTEDDQLFEVIPLPTPIITFVTQTVSQGEVVFASGSGVPRAFVEIAVSDENGQNVFRTETPTDTGGNWEVVIGEQFMRGLYNLTAKARDERSAVSFATDPISFKVRARVVLSMGPLDLGWFEITLLILLLITASGGVGAWYYIAEQQRRGAYKVIVLRDIDKISTLLSGNVGELEKWMKRSEKDIPVSMRTELGHYILQIKDTIGRMKKYLSKEVNKLG